MPIPAVLVLTALGCLTMSGCGEAGGRLATTKSTLGSGGDPGIAPTLPLGPTTTSCVTSCPPGTADTTPPINQTQSSYALRALANDPVLAPVAGHWHVLHLQTSSPSVFLELGFDSPVSLAWTETDEGCINGHGQPGLYSVQAPDLIDLLVTVDLAGAATRYAPGPNQTSGRRGQPAETQTLMRVLGPPNGPCPPPPPD